MEYFNGELEDDVDAGELEEEHQDQGDDEGNDHGTRPEVPDSNLKSESTNLLRLLLSF